MYDRGKTFVRWLPTSLAYSLSLSLGSALACVLTRAPELKRIICRRNAVVFNLFPYYSR